MLRRWVIGSVAGLMLPGSALACGMYLPPERTKLLAEVLDEIDQQAAIEQNRQAVEGAVQPPVDVPADIHEAVEAPSEPVLPPADVPPAPTADSGPSATVESSG